MTYTKTRSESEDVGNPEAPPLTDDQRKALIYIVGGLLLAVGSTAA